MIWIIYFIGSIIALFISKYYKEKDARQYYKELGIKTTNGQWFIFTVIYCILSWAIVIPIIISISSEFIWKQICKLDIVKKIKIWWNKPILEYKKSYDND